jgi:bile acid:Na+ symporter, BASS family
MLLNILDPLAEIELNFNQNMVWVMNLCIAIIMFSVALSMQKTDFVELKKSPKQVLVGVASQLFLLPFVTFLLVLIIKPSPGVALGMLLVACLPGGNVSNYFTLVGKGNPALSVSMTAIASMAAPIFTPLNFAFWGSKIPFVQELLKTINVSYWETFKIVVLILVIPMGLGLYFKEKFPRTTDLIKGKMQVLALLILIAFIAFAFTGNYRIFIDYYHHIIYLVFLHTLVAFSAGFLWGYMFTKNAVVARTISIETGIQNSGLGLVLIFTLFDGHGSMALITAWWGVYDIFAGLVAAYFFKWWVGREKVEVLEKY